MSVHWGGKGPGHVSRWPKAVGPVNTYSGATMLLDFLNPVLDPRITFSRGTNATLIDSTGRLTYAPNNLFTFSQEFDNAAWGKLNAGTALLPVVTANAGTAPDGTTTADRVQLSLNGGTASGDNAQVRQNIATSLAVTYIFSFWARATDGVSSYNLIAFGSPPAAQPITVTGAWTRFFVVGSGSNQNFALAIRGGQTPTNSNTADVLMWGAQLEAVTYQTTPSTYVATTASAYYGPRFDYDPVTLAPRGLLIEEARTNLLTYSDAFDNTTGWPTATNITITANVTASPDGTTNADRFDDGTAASVQHRLFRGFVTYTATAHTYSIFVKAGTGSWFQLAASDGTTSFYANFNVSAGTLGSRQASTTSTITNVGNGWYRCTMTFTAAAGTGNAQISMLDADTVVVVPTFNGANRTLFFYGAQLEAGSFATSYIPTVASTVTRNADVATMTGTNFSSWYNQSEGTFVSASDYVSATNWRRVLTVDDIAASGQNRMIVNAFSGQQLHVTNGGVVQADLSAGAGPSPNVVTQIASAYALNNFAAVRDGGAAVTDTSGTVPTVNRFAIGLHPNGSEYLNGHIRTIAYFNTRLPNAQLQTLTAPSLATTLHVDFTSGSYLVGF